jgi:hypothetical protein
MMMLCQAAAAATAECSVEKSSAVERGFVMSASRAQTVGNGHKTQLARASNSSSPWKRTKSTSRPTFGLIHVTLPWANGTFKGE